MVRFVDNSTVLVLGQDVLVKKCSVLVILMLSYKKEKGVKKMESSFAKNFKALRKERNMTQAEMGEILKISSMTVRRWENGSREPKMSTIEKIANVLEVDLLDLISTNDIIQYSRDILKRTSGKEIATAASPQSSKEERHLDIIISKAEQLSHEGRKKVINYEDDLINSGKYKKDPE